MVEEAGSEKRQDQEQYEKLPCVLVANGDVESSPASVFIPDGIDVMVSDPKTVDHSTTEEDSHGNWFTLVIEKVEDSVHKWQKENDDIIKKGIYGVLCALYFTYLFYALSRDFQRALPLVFLTLAVVVYYAWKLFSTKFQESIQGMLKSFWAVIDQHKTMTSWFTYFFLIVLMLSFLTVTGVFRSVCREPVRLVSVFGLLLLLIISFICSKHRTRINWKTVFWGLYLQILFALIILRTEPGYQVFRTVGEEVEVFLNYAMEGANFVFGSAPLTDHYFAFVVLPVVIYASAVFALLFYLGIMQSMINVLAWVMHHTMKVTGVEAFCAAANVFLGMTVVPMSIKPYLHDMTASEMHSMMVGGFATIAGGVLAVYIRMGVSAAHLLSASIISAPAALVAAKMFLPKKKKVPTATLR